MTVKEYLDYHKENYWFIFEMLKILPDKLLSDFIENEKQYFKTQGYYGGIVRSYASYLSGGLFANLTNSQKEYWSRIYYLLLAKETAEILINKDRSKLVFL